MVRNELPTSVQQLIQHHLDTAVDVDTLLLLRRDPRDWTARAVARELRIDVEQAASILARLRRHGLLRRAEDDSYRFDPREPDLAVAVARLAQLYPAYRVAVVHQIYARDP